MKTRGGVCDDSPRSVHASLSVAARKGMGLRFLRFAASSMCDIARFNSQQFRVSKRHFLAHKKYPCVLPNRPSSGFHALFALVYEISVHVHNAQITDEENSMNKDQVKGRTQEAKGKVKEVTGRILDDKGLEMEGNVQKNAGKIRAGVGDIKHDLKKGS
jgi:uncharacterized protein YjbJ (UPF0337 family)